MKILVVSLLRLGDAIMTTPVLNGLKKKYPNSDIHMLVNGQFKTLQSILPHVSRYHYFERQSLQVSLGNPQSPMLEAYDDLAKLVQQINHESFDLLINLTQNKLSGWLCAAIQAKVKHGLCLESSTGAEFGSNWFKYLNQQVAGGGRTVFHYSDIYYYGSDLDESERNWNLVDSQEGVMEAAPYQQDSRPYVVVQVLTSDLKKTWPKLQLCQALYQFQMMCPSHRVILLGAPTEHESIVDLQAACEKRGMVCESAILSLAGALQLLKGAALLLSGDTSIKHLANATSVPVIELSLGSSDFRKTGIYKAGSLILQPRVSCAPCPHALPCGQSTHRCAEILSPEIVSLAMNYIVKKNLESFKVAVREFSRDVEIFKTSHSVTGFWQARPIDEEFGQWSVERWLERSTWKFILQQEHLKSIGEYGSEGLRLLRDIRSQFPTLESQNITQVLELMEVEATTSNNEVDELLQSLQQAVRDGSEERISNLIEKLEDYFESSTSHDGVWAQLISNLWQLQSKGNMLDITGVRRLQMHLDETLLRIQIKLKLIRSVRAQMMESL